MDRVDRVCNRLHIGSLRAAKNENLLRNLHITHILTVCPVRPTHFDRIIYKLISIPDSPNHRIDIYFEECFQFIQEALESGGIVLVHCFQGISRSATILIAYLMKKRQLSFEKAFEYLKSRRPAVNPNFGFVDQLKNYESRIRSEQTA